MLNTSLSHAGVRSALCLAIAVVGACCTFDPLFEREISAEAMVTPKSVLVVRTENGAVQVKTTEGPMLKVKAFIGAETAERAAGVTLKLAQDGTDRFVVEPVWPDSRRGREVCRFEIEAPAMAGISVRTSNGRVSLDRPNGPTEVKTSNGAIEINGPTGPLDLVSSNGRIAIEGAAGPIVAKSSNGAVQAALLPTNPGPVNLKTSNGRIELAVGPSFCGALRAGTSNGRVTIDAAGAEDVRIDRTKGTARFGTGGAESQLETSNGAVAVRSL